MFIEPFLIILGRNVYSSKGMQLTPVKIIIEYYAAAFKLAWKFGFTLSCTVCFKVSAFIDINKTCRRASNVQKQNVLLTMIIANCMMWLWATDVTISIVECHAEIRDSVVLYQHFNSSSYIEHRKATARRVYGLHKIDLQR